MRSPELIEWLSTFQADGRRNLVCFIGGTRHLRRRSPECRSLERNRRVRATVKLESKRVHLSVTTKLPSDKFYRPFILLRFLWLTYFTDLESCFCNVKHG